MTKYKTTQKDAKLSNTVVLAVSYCFLQYALKHESPVAYNEGGDGWNFDLYEIDDRYNIVTGYRGMSRSSTHDVNDHRELKADLKQLECDSNGRTLGQDERKAKLIEILNRHLAD